jgi:Na+/H+ antiporter NhaD/arsenite permease-like protein
MSAKDSTNFQPSPRDASGGVELPAGVFVTGCAVVAGGLLLLGRFWVPPVWLLAVEIFATIIGLFVFGSFRYRIHKNALTYGMVLVIVATFIGIWWPTSALRAQMATEGGRALWRFVHRHVLTWHGLDHLIHADTMLFILGLTLFVSVIAQTRLLETIVFLLLRRNRGKVLPTTIAVTAVVGFASGILDGVSMIGLTIRTLIVIMFLANAPLGAVRFSVMLCTIVTTVCGMWLAYGEPPNLIMKANLRAPSGESYLTDAFFLRYCLPGAVASYLVIAWNLRRRFRGLHIDLGKLDVLDTNAGSLRFLQASRHGQVITPIELLEQHENELGDDLSERVQRRVQHGDTLGAAMVREQVPEGTRRRLLREFTSAELADSLDRHYEALVAGDADAARRFERSAVEVLKAVAHQEVRAQRIGLLGILVFVALLIGHAVDHRLPLFVASFAGFAVSLVGIVRIPKMRRLALRGAREEYAEYYFLFPLFLSISLLTSVGFFGALQDLVKAGIEQLGHGHVAVAQFVGCTVLSAILDNNVVADFGARALLGLEIPVLHLFAMAQIAGYAAGGCWTHIGSAQSVVAFALIRRDIDETYTPVQWLKEMTPPVLQTCAVLTLIIYVESQLLPYLR